MTAKIAVPMSSRPALFRNLTSYPFQLAPEILICMQWKDQRPWVWRRDEDLRP